MIYQSGTAEVELIKGNMIKITLDDAYQDNCSEDVLWLDYKNITKVVEVGSKIYIDDGLISLQVKEIGEWRFLTMEKQGQPQKNLITHWSMSLSPQDLITSCVRLRMVAPWGVRRE